MKNIILSIISAALVSFIALGVNTVAPAQKDIESDLPSVGTIENLQKLIEETKNNRGYYDLGVQELQTVDSYNSAMKSDAESPSSVKEQGAGYSKTNVQVQGVDEADIVKTDGKNIYQVVQNKVIISKVYPANEMKVIREIMFDEGSRQTFYPNELYLDDDYLIVIGTGYEQIEEKHKDLNKDIIYYPYYKNRSYTMALIYNLENYNLEREIEIEGGYLSSRKVNDDIYLISNKYIYTYNIEDLEELLPTYKDTCIEDEYKIINADSICYFPGFEEANYLMVAGFSLDKMNEEVEVSTYLGAGNNVYATSDNLYVTKANYNFYNNRIMPLVDTIVKVDNDSKHTTTIYKFSIDNGKIKYKAKGEVDGTIINQFAMDEYKGYFRIATTKGEVWNETSTNNLYILDRNMKLVGKVEDLAKGERIYSVRFMGDKAYMVTYRNVDPLFVIDVSSPSEPEVLGELKIPGYSSYLHPYKENYLIGFGNDTIVKKTRDWQGDWQENAYEVGLKMALFDVSDFNNPKEVYSIKIGDRGSYSELLYNHKSILFDEEKNIIAFPASITESKGMDSNGVPNYGETIFEGALVYGLDMEDGFNLKAKISHDKPNNKNYYYSSNIQRILYIDDVLYTTSQSMIKANDINTFKEIGKIKL